MTGRRLPRALAALSAAALLLPAPKAAAGQSALGFRRAAFLARPVGARAPGMGEAFTAVADDASALGWNPGGLGQVAAFTGLASYDYDAAGTGLGLSYVALAAPSLGGVTGLGLTALRYGELERREDDGRLAGSFAPWDGALALGWAGRNPSWLGGWTGLSAALVRDVTEDLLWAANVGSVVPVSRALTLGWSAVNLAPPSGDFLPPMSVRGGAVAAAGPAFRLMLDVGYGVPEKDWWLAAGAEAALAGLLVARVGYKHLGRAQAIAGLTGLAAGGGLRWRGLAFDGAWQPFGDLAQSVKVSLAYALPLPERAPAVTSPAGDAEAWYQESLRAHDLGEYDAALRWAKAAVQADAAHWRAWQLLGNCRFAKRDAPGAAEAYRRSLELNPDNPGARDQLARIERPREDAAPVVTAEGLYLTALDRYQAKRYEEAWSAAAECLKLEPGFWQAWQMIGNCQYARGDSAGAAASYRRALELNPDNPSLKAFLEQLPVAK